MSEALDQVENELLKIQLESMRRENSDLRNQVLSMPALPAIGEQAPENGSWADFVAKTEAELAEKDGFIVQLREECASAKRTIDSLVTIDAEKQAQLTDAKSVISDQEATLATSDANLSQAYAEIDRLRADVLRLDLAEDQALRLLDKEIDANVALRADKARLEGDLTGQQASVSTTPEVERLQAALELAGKENALRRQMVAELQSMLANKGRPFAYPGVELVGFAVDGMSFIDVRLTYNQGASWFTALQVSADVVRFVPRVTARDIERMIDDSEEQAEEAAA